MEEWNGVKPMARKEMRPDNEQRQLWLGVGVLLTSVILMVAADRLIVPFLNGAVPEVPWALILPAAIALLAWIAWRTFHRATHI